MSEEQLAEMSETLNKEARRRYPAIASSLGTRSVTSALAPRLALKRETPYPYSLRGDSELLPPPVESFGRVIVRDREEGLREIHASISTQSTEHNWLFIPSLNAWVDTATTSDTAQTQSDWHTHIFLSHMYPELETVHTHPDRVLEEALSKTHSEQLSDNYLLEGALPSNSDLRRHMELANHSAEGSKLKSSVVSHYGVTSIVALDGEESGNLFYIGAYDRVIEGPLGTPEDTIRAALDLRSSHTLHLDGSPAFAFSFEPIAPNR